MSATPAIKAIVVDPFLAKVRHWHAGVRELRCARWHCPGSSAYCHATVEIHY
jgi:hypothetical protein